MSFRERITKIATSRVLFLLLLAYLCTITALSHIQGQSLNWVNIWDKGVHLVEYFPLGVLVAGWIIRRAERPRTAVTIILGICSMVVFGALDEFHQSFVPGRHPSGLDVAADTIGGAAGVLAGVWFFSPRK
jgi:VanZ family protein